MTPNNPTLAETGVVLVPGACHGSWWYEPLVTALRTHGFAATPLTLTGLGPDDDGTARVNLDDHVQEVRDAIAVTRQRVDRIVLVGHSYAGSVITAAADGAPEDVDALVYLDAFVPEDGESCFSLASDEFRRWYVDGSGRTGFALDPLPSFDARARPHPLATLVQKSRLTGAWRRVAVKHYAEATLWPGASPFATTIERIRSESGWTQHTWDTPHNVLHDGPDRVLQLLLAVAADLDGRGGGVATSGADYVSRL